MSSNYLPEYRLTNFIMHDSRKALTVNFHSCSPNSISEVMNGDNSYASYVTSSKLRTEFENKIIPGSLNVK